LSWRKVLIVTCSGKHILAVARVLDRRFSGPNSRLAVLMGAVLHVTWRAIDGRHYGGWALMHASDVTGLDRTGQDKTGQD